MEANWERELHAACRAAGHAADIGSPTGGLTVRCPVCMGHPMPLDVAEGMVMCGKCDFTATGEPWEITAAMTAARPAAAAVSSEGSAALAVPLGTLARSPADDPEELIRKRFLCRGGGMLLVGPSGIGKSSFNMQLGMCLSLGKTVFGIQPARPLRILLIQAENDDGDLAEMRDGVLAGLTFTDAEKARALAEFMVHRCDEKSGEAFFEEVAEPLIKAHRPDIVIIDPVFAYMAGDVKSSTDVGVFARKLLNPLIRRYSCGVILVHHTNKPAAGREKPDWSGADFAYLGAGSAEWTNWARAVMVIRQLEDGIFELRAAKRGMRIGWLEADGRTRTTHRFIRHSSVPGAICWEEVTDYQVEDADTRKKRGKKTSVTVEEVHSVLMEGGGKLRARDDDPQSLTIAVATKMGVTRPVAVAAIGAALAAKVIKLVLWSAAGDGGGRPQKYFVSHDS